MHACAGAPPKVLQLGLHLGCDRIHQLSSWLQPLLGKAPDGICELLGAELCQLLWQLVEGGCLGRVRELRRMEGMSTG